MARAIYSRKMEGLEFFDTYSSAYICQKGKPWDKPTFDHGAEHECASHLYPTLLFLLRTLEPLIAFAFAWRGRKRLFTLTLVHDVGCGR